MSVQKCFSDFNDKIKLDYSTKSDLADKRDILVEKLRKSGQLPSFSTYDQGSYGMSLGVEPLKKTGREYDIDVGLIFNANKDDYEPLKLKETIQTILNNHTTYGATIKRPCVTVTYMEDGKRDHHVDFVVYLYEDHEDKDSQLYLAKGKASTPDEIGWEKSDPKGLVQYINDRFTKKEERSQFRRVIRYIKRWKNLRFDSNGHAEPSSIGITLIAVESFVYREGDDLTALLDVAKQIQKLFYYTYDYDTMRWLYKIKKSMPEQLKFESNTDAFGKMTSVQQNDFKLKIDKFVKDLEEVKDETDEQEQYKKLRKIFGEDFIIPDPQNSYRHQNHNYIPASSTSGCV